MKNAAWRLVFLIITYAPMYLFVSQKLKLFLGCSTRKISRSRTDEFKKYMQVFEKGNWFT